MNYYTAYSDENEATDIHNNMNESDKHNVK